MDVDLSPELLAEVQEFHGLPHAALVEKDFYVVKALRALTTFNGQSPHLIFGGGTALCRAHRLIQRMSEDIDLKIVSDAPLNAGQRRQFRSDVAAALREAGFVFDPENPAHRQVYDGGKTVVFQLPYDAVATPLGSLRAEGIKIELSSWPTYRPPVNCSVSSFVAEATRREPEVLSVACAAVLETASEKFVALTRRIGEERANGDRSDPALLRHIYDLHRVRPHLDLSEAGILIRQIMQSDAASRGARFPAYQADAVGETHRALEAMRTDVTYRDGFSTFQRDMVYGDHAEFGECMDTLSELQALIA